MPSIYSGPGDRLPASFRAPFLGPWVGPLVLRPWFDRLALPLIARWFFPLSRAWAAAEDCEDDVDAFLAAAYGAGSEDTPAASSAFRKRAAHLLRVTQARRRTYLAAERDWEAAYFGSGRDAAGPGTPALVAAQTVRQDAAQEFMAARATALPLHLARRFPPLRFDVVPPAQTESVHGCRLRDPRAAFGAPEMPAVEESRRVPTPRGADHWLRFASPRLGDTAWARVSTPARGEALGAAPSFIFLHGIAMETEFWHRLVDPSLPLMDRGVRLIRAEGPWHGRRRPRGWFGGEWAMARGPLGFIELFQSWVAEVAVLIAWARRSGKGRVAVGGVSLGALTAQMVAAAARDWPTESRPDALFLVATSGDLADVTEKGSLSDALGMPARLRSAGWTSRDLARWAPLLQPVDGPGIDPAKIVMVLGQADDLLPFDTGLDLARRWGVPSRNLFTRPQGHFSVSLGLDSAPEPLVRLTQVLGAA